MEEVQVQYDWQFFLYSLVSAHDLKEAVTVTVKDLLSLQTTEVIQVKDMPAEPA